MAASYIPRPGTKYGPCEESCEHLNCKVMREEARASCPFCHSAIGYGSDFYALSADDLAHAGCYEQSIEEDRCTK